MAEDAFDIAIVGAGPAGLTLALALVRAMDGLKIAVLDRRPIGIPRDQRASAIGAGARRAFEALGVWRAVAKEAEPVRRMKVTDSGSGDIARPLFLQFDSDAGAGEPIAHMVPNTALARELLAALEGRVTFLAPVGITGFSGTGPMATLALEDGRTISATLVAAADGAMSALRGFAGIGTVDHDYRQVGVVTTISHELPHEGVAYEHFRPEGPFASLPLKSSEETGNRSSLVWTTSPEIARKAGALPLDAVAREIEDVMGHCLGSVTLNEPLQVFPLTLKLARAFVGPRLALVGDAAHVIHPLAGQGLNLGLKDAAALAEVAIEALRLGLDPGSADTLEKYQRWRRLDTALMAALTDSMNRLFSNDAAPVRALRDIGLGVVDRVAPLKEALIARAAGVDRGGPKLLRGLPV